MEVKEPLDSLQKQDLETVKLNRKTPDYIDDGELPLDQLPNISNLSQPRELEKSVWDDLTGEHPWPDAIEFSEERIIHILYGDENGGGHLYGQGHSGKHEFPQNWSTVKILNNVLEIARYPDEIVDVHEYLGYWSVQGVCDGVKVRVIIYSGDHEYPYSICSAFPVSGPDVRRNPYLNEGI